MPPRRHDPNPLDVDVLRASLDAGKIARVGIAPSGQFPEGAAGRVRRIGSPESDGPDYLFVEVTVGGAKDVIPFAPADLRPPARRGRAGAAAGPEPMMLPAVSKSAHPSPASARHSAPAAGPAPGIPSTATTPANLPRPRTDPVAAAGAADRQPGIGAGGRPRGRKRSLPAVTIIVSAEAGSGAWSVQARIGSKAAIRERPLSPAGVSEIARQLGDPDLIRVVDTLLAEQRQAVQAKADALAAELAAVRAELAGFGG